jgi:hypothetical protein
MAKGYMKCHGHGKNNKLLASVTSLVLTDTIANTSKILTITELKIFFQF